MNIPEIIAELFGGAIVEGDIAEAFSVDHPDFLARPYFNAVSKKLLVNGDFFSRDPACHNAGRFERSLYRVAGDPIAFHDRIIVREAFRRKGLAKAHLSKLLKFYRSSGIKRIFLKAVDWGPIVWPALGFQIHRTFFEPIQDEFRSLYVADIGQPPEWIPDWAPGLALATSPKGTPIGALALREGYIKLGERPIPMVLELWDGRTESFLRDRGML